MIRFEWYHFILLCYSFIVYRNSLINKDCNKYKLQRIDNFAYYLPQCPSLHYHILFLSMLPVITLMSKIDINMIEHLFSLFTYIASYNALQNTIDPSITILFILPFITIFLLTCIKNNIISKSLLSNVYIYITILALLHISTYKIHTINVVNQIIIVHVFFYLFK